MNFEFCNFSELRNNDSFELEQWPSQFWFLKDVRGGPFSFFFEEAHSTNNSSNCSVK